MIFSSRKSGGNAAQSSPLAPREECRTTQDIVSAHRAQRTISIRSEIGFPLAEREGYWKNVHGIAGKGTIVGFYAQMIFPRICDFFMNSPLIANYRRELLVNVHGDILEIGFGTGLNIANYPAQIHKLTAVDPNPGMHKLAKNRIEQMGMEVDLRVLDSERLPFQDNSFDCIVSTFTLCSIQNVNQALREVCRTLKPGGQFLFLEHGLSPEANVRKWQQRLNWLQMRLADGCRLDRNIGDLIAAQPFTSVEVENSYVEKAPKTHGYLYRGVATK